MDIVITLLLLIAGIVYLLTITWKYAVIAISSCCSVYGIYRLFLYIYFSSKKFTVLKESIKKNVQDCNELNSHIEDLKHSYKFYKKRLDVGISSFTDNSLWNYQRTELSKFKEGDNIHHCSRQVCANARTQPFKYVCKYFDIDCNEETLAFYEDLINKFSAVEQGKASYIAERDALINSIRDKVPTIILWLSKKRLYQNLGIKPFDLKDKYYPSYQFLYISSGGNSSLECTVDFDTPTLEKFAQHIVSVIERKNSIAFQRQLMTRELREQIKSRDEFKCAHCGVSVSEEPHLLLEVDHIIPVSKGGKTVPENLQTLCWRCNRSKGDKLMH